jgi:hypothetical protein
MWMGWSSCRSSLRAIAELVARGLAPVRLRSSRQSGNVFYLKRIIELYWGRCAAQREQAPSPQGFELPRYNGMYRLNNARNAAGFTGLAK